jgi:stearoyl-CoA desaturase (delta-9 desaturase)
LAWIDRHWLPLYLAGLALPAVAGLIVGGTAYDALMGFLWGGLLRHFVALQATFAVNSITHVCGKRPYETADQSRNNLLIGILAFGEGWHNNHHAFPFSARHGLSWFEIDMTWWHVRLLSFLRLADRVRLPSEVMRRKLAYASIPPISTRADLKTGTG